MALALPFPAVAEQMIVTVAPENISIASSYSGGSVVAFGAIQTDVVPAGGYDVTVTVRGPLQNVVTRQKRRVAGIWVNADSKTFVNIPSFLGVFANRDFKEIAGTDTLAKFKIGFDNGSLTGARADDPYLENLVSIRTEEKLFLEDPRGVEFLSPRVFRVAFPLPQTVLTGTYDIEFVLFANGKVVAQRSSSFNVAKVGVEAFVVKAAVNDSLLYGLATMAMALMTGWLASVVFRKN
jgi:uncharacterized protein (TIGR02186 family)